MRQPVAKNVIMFVVIKKMKKKNKAEAGFTLFELLVVISIIGILIAVVSTSYAQAQKRSRDARRHQDIKAVQKALEQYYAVNGHYPTNCNPGTSYLPSGLPQDPKPGYSYSWKCANSSYCLCAHLETGGGNADNTGSSSGCHYQAGNYFCASNLQ